MSKNDYICSLDQYLLDISKYKKLDANEENDLFLKYKRFNSEEAKKILFESNLSRVYDIALSLKSDGFDILDLIQEGNIGLMKSIERFDIYGNNTFEVYSYFCIKTAMKNALELKSKNVKIPIKLYRKYNGINFIFKSSENIDGKLTPWKEITRRVRCSKEEAKSLYPFVNNTLTNGGDLSKLEDSTISFEENIDDKIMNDSLKEMLIILMDRAVLTEREIYILKLRFGMIDGAVYTFTEIGENLKISKERVRQIIDKSFEKIKLVFGNDDYFYLDNPILAKKMADEVKSNISYNGDGSVRKQLYLEPSIYNFFREYDKAKVDEMISRLSLEEKELLEKKYSEKSSKKDVLDFYNTLVPVMKKLLVEQDSLDSILTDADIYDMGNEKIFEVMDNLSIMDITIISLKFGYIDGILRSDEEVGSMLRLSLEEVIKSISKYKNELLKQNKNDNPIIRERSN